MALWMIVLELVAEARWLNKLLFLVNQRDQMAKDIRLVKLIA